MRAHHELDADGRTLLLTAADAANHSIANQSVGALLQAQLREHRLNDGLLLLKRYVLGQTERSAEGQCLAWRLRAAQNVFLDNESQSAP